MRPTHRVFDTPELPFNVYSNVVEDQECKEEVTRVDKRKIVR
jgi:hypothetical protein